MQVKLLFESAEHFFTINFEINRSGVEWRRSLGSWLKG